MASSDEESVEVQSVRRTRSGRTVKTPPTAVKPRKSRKKVMLVEVEVSEEEEQASTKTIENQDSESENNVDSSQPDDGSFLNQSKSNDASNEAVNTNTDNSVQDDEMETSFLDDSNSVARSDRPFTFTTESTQDQFETSDQENVTFKNNFSNSFPMAISESINEDSRKDECSLEIDETEDTLDQLEKSPDVPDESSNQDSQMKEDENPDTEVISEDELPTVQAVKVPETEEVSDDELPGPRRAELPADTEVVSEDELPAIKKEGVKRKLEESSEYDPGSPTSENEVSAKRPATTTITIKIESSVADSTEKLEKDKTSDKNSQSSTPAKDVKPKLPELDKYWKAVNDDPSDFTGWTYLLQYVDQVNDIEAAREAYDAFLSHYPYCYGYWRKYADYEKRKGNKKKCEDVFERGLKAIPLSVDLWLHFLSYTKTAYVDNENHIREQFERALAACGLEFRSDRLWDTYIKWETEGKRYQNVTGLYDRLLSTPTQGYTTHFDNFQEHVSLHAPSKILSVDEFLALRKEVRQMLKNENETTSADNPDAPPGEDNEADDSVQSDEETKAIKEKIVSIRRKLNKVTIASIISRWNFEEGIKRPYFHVKPLERCQLKNWKEYLDYEIEQGDRQRIVVLFERCLIACALYEEFWLRYVRYLEEQKDETLHSKIREVYERACTVHHVGKPALHLAWAIYEEASNNLTKASEILVNLEKSVPNLLQVAYRRINLERRRGDFEKCAQLYEYYINNSKNKFISNNMAIKYARFCLKICKDFDKAVEILKSAILKDSSNQRLYLQLIDICLQRENIDEKEILELIDNFLEKDTNDSEQKVIFAQRKLEFLEDFGSDIQAVQKAYEDFQKYCKLSKEKKKKEEKGDGSSKKSKSDAQPPLPNTQSTYSGYGSYGSSTGQTANSYSYGGQQPGYSGQYGGQYPQSGDQYQYPNWQYSQSGYGSYNQWGNYEYGYDM